MVGESELSPQCAGWTLWTSRPSLSLDTLRTSQVDVLSPTINSISKAQLRTIPLVRWHRTDQTSLALCAGFTAQTLRSLFALRTSSAHFALDALRARFTAQTLRPLIALRTASSDFAWDALSARFTTQTLRPLIALWTSGTDFTLDSLRAGFTTQTLRPLIALRTLRTHLAALTLRSL